MTLTRFNNASADLRNKIDQGKAKNGLIVDINRHIPLMYSVQRR